MNRSLTNSRLFALHALSAIALTLVPAVAAAQHTTTTSERYGDPSHETTVRDAQVVYVEGNDLVLKLEDGKVEHMIVPANEKFTVDGHQGTVRDLKTGARLTQTITTTNTPRYVQTVQVIKGKVWHVKAPSLVIVSMPGGQNHLFRVPSHAKFTVNGQPKTVFDLRKGMSFEATIVTDSPETEVAVSKTNVAYVPEPTTPVLMGVLLIDEPMPRMPELRASVTAEHVDPPSMLPKTASAVPLLGFLGLAGIASSFGLWVRRRAVSTRQ